MAERHQWRCFSFRWFTMWKIFLSILTLKQSINFNQNLSTTLYIYIYTHNMGLVMYFIKLNRFINNFFGNLNWIAEHISWGTVRRMKLQHIFSILKNAHFRYISFFGYCWYSCSVHTTLWANVGSYWNNKKLSIISKLQVVRVEG